MSVKVKICGITNPADGLAAAAAGADMIGLMFCPQSPRQLSIEAAAAISKTVPPHVAKVGVFVDPAEEFVVRAIRECGLGLVQFHGDESPGFCVQFGVMSLKAFRIRDAASLDRLPLYSTEGWLLDACSPKGLGGTGEQFNWELAVEAKKFGRPIFLAGGLTPENAAAAVRKVRPYALDVSSGVESAPGKKDHEKIRRFISAVRSVPPA